MNYITTTLAALFSGLSCYRKTVAMAYPEFFWRIPVDTLNSRRRHHMVGAKWENFENLFLQML